MNCQGVGRQRDREVQGLNARTDDKDDHRDRQEVRPRPRADRNEGRPIDVLARAEVDSKLLSVSLLIVVRRLPNGMAEVVLQLQRNRAIRGQERAFPLEVAVPDWCELKRWSPQTRRRSAFDCR